MGVQYRRPRTPLRELRDLHRRGQVLGVADTGGRHARRQPSHVETIGFVYGVHTDHSGAPVRIDPGPPHPPHPPHPQHLAREPGRRNHGPWYAATRYADRADWHP
jgi:hypothetical protein